MIDEILETTLHRDRQGVVTAFRGQDVEPLIDHNDAIKKNLTKQEAHKKSIYKVGTIPSALAEYIQMNGFNIMGDNAIKKYVITSPLLSKFRCYEGAISQSPLDIATKRALDRLISKWSECSGIVKL